MLCPPVLHMDLEFFCFDSKDQCLVTNSINLIIFRGKKINVSNEKCCLCLHALHFSVSFLHPCSLLVFTLCFIDISKIIHILQLQNNIQFCLCHLDWILTWEDAVSFPLQIECVFCLFLQVILCVVNIFVLITLFFHSHPTNTFVFHLQIFRNLLSFILTFLFSSPWLISRMNSSGFTFFSGVICLSVFQPSDKFLWPDQCWPLGSSAVRGLLSTAEFLAHFRPFLPLSLHFCFVLWATFSVYWFLEYFSLVTICIFALSLMLPFPLCWVSSVLSLRSATFSICELTVSGGAPSLDLPQK